MSHDQRTFVDLCLNGEAFVDEIDDYVDLWHEGRTGLKLHEFLGLTHPEYALIVEKPESVKFIMYARKYGRPLSDFRSMPQSFRLAARALSPEDAEDLIAWLKQTGRISD